MHRALAALSLLLAACPAAAIEKRKTVYPDRMMGFERHVRAAIRETTLNVGILDESIQPDFRLFGFTDGSGQLFGGGFKFCISCLQFSLTFKIG